MIKSSKTIDKRLLNQYMIQQAHRMGVPTALEELKEINSENFADKI